MADSIEAQIKGKAREWITEFDHEFFVELIETYLVDAPKRIVELKKALSEGNQEVFTRAAHTLKSSTAQLGGVSFSDLAQTIELGSRTGRMVQLGAEVQQLENDFHRIKTILESVKAMSADQLLATREI